MHNIAFYTWLLWKQEELICHCVIGLVGPVKTKWFLLLLPSEVQSERVSDTCACPCAKAVKPRADRRVCWWREPNVALG